MILALFFLGAGGGGGGLQISDPYCNESRHCFHLLQLDPSFRAA